MFCLLMSSDPEFVNEGEVHYPNDRIFEFTKAAIKAEHRHLNANDRRYIANLPALAIAEFPNEQPGWLVKITSINVVTDGCTVRFKKEKSQASIPFATLKERQNHLGIETPETFTHHLALKDIDLYSVLGVSKPFRLICAGVYSSIEHFVTKPIWKGVSVILGVLLILASIGRYFYVEINSSINDPKLDKPVEKEVSETATNFNLESPEIKLNDINRARTDTETGLDKLTDFVDKLVEDRNQFEYLNGREPQNNFTVFLQKYYGLDNNPALGDALIEDMLHKEVEWAVKVVDIIPSDDSSQKAFVIFEVNDPLCPQDTCPEGFQAEGIAGYDSIDGIPSIVKKGDFIHIQGKMHRFLNVVGEPDVPLRRRMFIVPNKTRYYEKN